MVGPFFDQRPPNWFVRLCKYLWRQRNFVWGSIILNILLDIFVSWLFIDHSNIPKTPMGWFFQHSSIVLLIGICLTLITFIIYLGSHFDVVTSDNQRKRRYLNSVIREWEYLTLTGFPLHLVRPGVQLDQVFVPLQLRTKEPSRNYPLTKEEIKSHLDRLQSEALAPGEERWFLDAYDKWQSSFETSKGISIIDFWHKLTRKKPVAVIQGFPGMGKSTLLARLALYMARCNLKQPDSMMPDHLKPPLIPILLNLGDYALELAEDAELRLLEYLKKTLSKKFSIGGIDSYLEKCLKAGRCLVMLDGLDEVSDPKIRTKVQEAIVVFVRENCDTSDSDFNRFLITSRIVISDSTPLGNYDHYMIAELTTEQIMDFLFRWNRANLRRRVIINSTGEQEEEIVKEATRMAGDFSADIERHQGVHHLAENPLMLTLLILMKEYSGSLLVSRIDLYKEVTKMLLESLNIVKNLPPIPEPLAIQLLCPLAFQMQAKGNSLASKREVVASLDKSIASTKDTIEEIGGNATSFLALVHERSGLFVLRTDDYYGFFHLTFQEYFAARYMLKEIERDQAKGIGEFVNRVRNTGGSWRESFLLAVAYKSYEDKKEEVSEIMHILLTSSPDADLESKEHDLFLATECLIESKPLTIDRGLEKQIARQLLQTYAEAQQGQRLKVCNQVEGLIRRWLLSLPNLRFPPPILAVMSEVISDTGNVVHQRSALTLLITVAGQLTTCSPIVFKSLIPPLLALAGLQTVGGHEPITDLPSVPDLMVSDLALTALSFMRKQGPAGLLLPELRRRFKSDPEYQYLLARCSIENRTLLTFSVIPQTEDNYLRYELAVKQWLALRKRHRTGHAAEREVNDCLRIHQTLLDCAETVRYPSAILLSEMLKAAKDNPMRPWEEVWQEYLSEQLSTGSYINYQEVALLWFMLFPGKTSLEKLARLILDHNNNRDGNNTERQRYAQRFLAAFSNDLRYLIYLLYFRDMGHQHDEPQYLLDLGDLRDLRSLQKLPYPQNLRTTQESLYLRYLRDLGDLRDIEILRDIKNLQNLKRIRDLRDLHDLRDRLLTREVAETTVKRLPPNCPVPADQSEYIELLTILLGRILHILEAGEMGDAIEAELQQIAQTAEFGFTATDNNESCEAILEIMRYLPARSMNEIKSVLRLAGENRDTRIQQACAVALRRSVPCTPDAWHMLESALHTKVLVISVAVKERLERRKRGE
jgi:hypothetical protein